MFFVQSYDMLVNAISYSGTVGCFLRVWRIVTESRNIDFPDRIVVHFYIIMQVNNMHSLPVSLESDLKSHGNT